MKTLSDSTLRGLTKHSLIKTIKELYAIREEAIKYIEENKYIIREYTSANSGTKKIYELCCEPDELLEILQGNKENK